MIRSNATTLTALVACVVGILAICIAGPTRLIFELVGVVAFGWLTYLGRVLPNVNLGWEGIATMIVCLALFTFGLHRMLRWFYAEIQKTGAVVGETTRTWSPRWTFSLVVLILLMFVVGIAASGIIHQGGWLLASRDSLVELKPPYFGRSDSSEAHLKICAMGLYSFVEGRGRSGDGVPRRTFPLSWMARMLPDLGYYLSSDVRRDLPWNDPENSAYYKGMVPEFLNPEVLATRTPEGYGLGHYAGNVHALGSHAALPRSAISDSSQLIAAGEVAEGFKAWGDPANLRDPGLGVNKAPGGFGGPSGAGAFFLFMDGSVRYLKASTDVDVLRRLSRPYRMALASTELSKSSRVPDRKGLRPPAEPPAGCVE